MSNHKPKSLTAKALQSKREAHIERRKRNPPALADCWELDAERLLELQNPPDVGVGGEVVQEQTAGLGFKRGVIRDTLAQGADQVAEDASIRRAHLLMQAGCMVGARAARRYTAATPGARSRRGARFASCCGRCAS